jgi:hypothetical protein
MSNQIVVTEISGSTANPISVYISDVYGNNQSLIAVINSGPVPPIISYTSVIPTAFNTAPQVVLTMTDSDECEIFKTLQCTF